MKPIITVFESIHSDGLDKLLSFADVRVALGATREEQLVLSEISSDGRRCTHATEMFGSLIYFHMFSPSTL